MDVSFFKHEILGASSDLGSVQMKCSFPSFPAAKRERKRASADQLHPHSLLSCCFEFRSDSLQVLQVLEVLQICQKSIKSGEVQ